MLIEGQEVNKISSGENDSHTGLRCAIFFFCLGWEFVHGEQICLYIVQGCLNSEFLCLCPCLPSSGITGVIKHRYVQPPGVFLFLKFLQSVNLFKTKDIDERRKPTKVWKLQTG